jgi:hypothetical protein
MGGKRNLAGKLSAPLIAAGASLATRYAVKKGPQLVEHAVLPWLREAAQGAGGVAEELPDKARTAVNSGGDLAEQLTDRARDVTDGGGGLSQDELSQRSDERAKRRAQRRKSTKKTTNEK